MPNQQPHCVGEITARERPDGAGTAKTLGEILWWVRCPLKSRTGHAIHCPDSVRDELQSLWGSYREIANKARTIFGMAAFKMRESAYNINGNIAGENLAHAIHRFPVTAIKRVA
jgi:hypothetical protein